MSDTLLNAEAAIRLTVFLGILVAMMLWELAAPRRRQEIPRVLRWSNNLGLVVLDTLILRLSFPILAVGLAVIGAERGWGLFNTIDAPGWVAILASVLLLDLAIYLQHVLFHAVPGLWRLHRMHHADLEFDAIVVTPDMHRVHHSTDPRETNSNYGFNLPWWDRLLGTYVAQPAKGHDGMEIGIEQFRTRRDLWLDRMLVQPLRGPASGGALDPRITSKEPTK